MAFDDGVKTVSGSVAHTDDAATKVPFVSVKCGIKPTLTGVSSVTEKQTGKNLLLPHKADSAEITVNGIKRSYSLDNQEFTFNGTNTKTDASWLIFSINISDFVLNGLKSGVTYRFSHNLTADFYAQFTYNKSGGGVGAMGYLRGTAGRNASVSFTLPNDFDSLKQFQIGVSNTATDVDITAHFQVEFGSTAHDYEPYTAPTTYTASLGRTIYGGTADIVNGEGVETYVRIDLGSLTWSNNASYANVFNGALPTGYVGDTTTDFICEDYANATSTTVINEDMPIAFNYGRTVLYCHDNRFSDWSDFKQAVQGKYVVYKCTAKATDFTFTPITPTPETVGNVNNVYCNTGDTEVTYHDNAHGFAEVTVNKTGKNLISVPIFTPSTPTLCFDAGKDITVSNITMSFLATNAVVHATNAAIVDYRKEDGTHTYRTLNWFRDANNNQFTANTPQNGKFKNSNSNITFRYIYIYYESITYSMFESDCISEWQIELASTASDYTPYEAVSKTAYLHKVIYGGKADVVKGTCEPKNLLDSADASHTFTSGTNTRYTVGTIALKGGVTYTFSAYQEDALTSNTRNTLVINDNGDYTYEYATGSNYHNQSGVHSMQYTPNADKTVTLLIWVHTPSNDVTYSEFQVEKGSSASDFAPYFEPFSFPPISMSTDEGENNLFANEGDSAITYRKAVD